MLYNQSNDFLKLQPKFENRHFSVEQCFTSKNDNFRILAEIRANRCFWWYNTYFSEITFLRSFENLYFLIQNTRFFKSFYTLSKYSHFGGKIQFPVYFAGKHHFTTENNDFLNLVENLHFFAQNTRFFTVLNNFQNKVIFDVNYSFLDCQRKTPLFTEKLQFSKVVWKSNKISVFHHCWTPSGTQHLFSGGSVFSSGILKIFNFHAKYSIFFKFWKSFKI